MKVWHVLADDCEAVVVDRTPRAAVAQLGRPDAQVWEQEPTSEIFGVPAVVIPGMDMPFLLGPNCQPMMLYWRAREA